MPNRGIAPFDPASEVGQFRVLADDTVYKPLDPPEEGFGDYEKWSDAEIQAFLLVSDSLSRSIYAAYLQLATRAAQESREVSDYDLRVNTTKRADQLLAVAREWKARADEEEEQSGGGDFFDVFFSPSCRCARTPELATRPCLCRGR